MRLSKLLEANRGAVETTEPREESLYDELRTHCPECKSESHVWYEGPSGGMSTNIFCGKCGQGYNVAPVMGWAEKIHRDERYISTEGEER
jgi:transcription elongation factor Elf1